MNNAKHTFKRLKMSGKRILVNLHNKQVADQPVAAQFSQSVVEYFKDNKLSEHITQVNANPSDNKLILSNDWTKGKPVKLKRPRFCPITNISAPEFEKLPEDIKNRGIDVGAAILLESSDGKILLTRRATTLRTFPGVWVPPGGHLEENETFEEAGLRECCEETGLNISTWDIVLGNINVLALWESVFPPKLSLGAPKRHHIVVYLHGKLKPEFDSNTLNKQLKLEPAEVCACAWLDKDLIKAITEAKEEREDGEEGPGGNGNQNLPKSIRGLTVDNDGQREADIPVTPLVAVSATESDHERKQLIQDKEKIQSALDRIDASNDELDVTLFE